MMMNDVMIVVRMLIDLMMGGDPTLPPGHNELVTIARLLSEIRDWVETWIWRS